MKREMKRKGFTLVELLIVIVVIGVLSAMMMLSSTEAVSSAKASNIVSNLRNLKTAALAFYTSSMDYFSASPSAALTNYQANIRHYLSGKNTGTNVNPELNNYTVVNDKGTWWVVHEIQGSDAEVNSIKGKLAGRAKSIGLVTTTGKDQAPSDADAVYDGSGKYLALQVQ